MDAAQLDSALGNAPSPDDRLAWFAALLASEAHTYVEVVGGSAIEIYLSSSEYVSQDVDLVGKRDEIANVLRRWAFREVRGRSQRSYWFKPAVGLVDLVGPVSRSGLPGRRVETPYGPAMISAVEPLIMRRLVRAQRERSSKLFSQAVALSRRRELDWEYLAAEAKFERVTELLERLKRASKRRPARTGAGHTGRTR